MRDISCSCKRFRRKGDLERLRGAFIRVDPRPSVVALRPPVAATQAAHNTPRSGVQSLRPAVYL